MIPAAISLRYARALVDLADKAGRLEKVAAGLEQLNTLCLGHDELQAVIRHPGFSVEQRTGIFNELMTRLGLDDLLRPFLGLIIEKGRLPALAGICQAVQNLTDDKLGRVRAFATSARPLSPAHCDAVAAVLEKRVGYKVVLETEVDASLIAGLQVQLGSELFDGSVKGRLDRLGRQLLAK